MLHKRIEKGLIYSRFRSDRAGMHGTSDSPTEDGGHVSGLRSLGLIFGL